MLVSVVNLLCPMARCTHHRRPWWSHVLAARTHLKELQVRETLHVQMLLLSESIAFCRLHVDNARLLLLCMDWCTRRCWCAPVHVQQQSGATGCTGMRLSIYLLCNVVL